jgi:hypothetical protein
MLKKSKFAPEHKDVSRVPNGGYTLTSGSNYMLDGFQFDTEYNGGVLEKARLPEAKGLSSLPSGMIPNDSPLFSEIPSHTDEDGGIHLGDFIKEASDQFVPIVDHSWLAQETKENLEGVRSKKDIYEGMDEGFYSDSNLKELEMAWSTSTTGLELVPNENRKHPKYTNPERDIDSLPGDDYRASIEKAMRRSAYGEPIRTIVADLKNEMGRRYNESIGDKIASEHGLHGKVYVKEEAFPGLFNGRWDKVIKKRCASAMYIIPNAQDCAYDYHQGRKVVNNINWKKAFNTYSPKLKTVGIKLGSGENYKNRLRTAFLSTAPAPIQPQTWFETEEDLTKRYTSDQAQELLDEYTPEVDYVDSVSEREERNLYTKFATLLDKFLKLGMISEDQYEDIASTDDINKKSAKLDKYATMPKEASDYMGLGLDKKGMFGKVIQEIDPHYTTPQQRELQAQENKFNRLASDLLRLGLASENQINKIASMDTDHFNKTKELTKIAAKPVLTKKGSYIGSGLNISTMEGKKYANEFSKIDSAGERELAIRNRVAQDKIQKLIQAKLISKKQVEKIACGCSSPEQVVERSINSITQQQTDISSRQYDQTIFEQLNLLKEAKNDFQEFQSQLLNKSERERITVQANLENRLNRLIQANVIDKSDVNKVLAGANNTKTKIARIVNYLNQVEQKEYSDTQYTHHIESKKATFKLASAESVEKWVRQKMAEGNMGKDLDVLLQTKFASGVLDHYGEKIGSLRKAHEGLSGQVYVDAQAYDTPNGVTGCEQGALQHRANTIPAVLQMDKCATCVYKNAEDICQKYNKPIIASVELLGIDNPRKYQREAIKLANSSDSEKTASLFTNNYDEDEFSLTTNDELEIDEEQTPQALADVLFGGFEV